MRGGHLEVRQCPVGVVLFRAELAEVEQGDDVELRQQARIELVDVAEEHLVAPRDLGRLDRQLDVAVVLLRRGRDAQYGIVAAVPRRLDADVVMPAGAEVKDRRVAGCRVPSTSRRSERRRDTHPVLRSQ
jgi:hypothetical protein